MGLVEQLRKRTEKWQEIHKMDKKEESLLPGKGGKWNDECCQEEDEEREGGGPM